MRISDKRLIGEENNWGWWSPLLDLYIIYSFKHKTQYPCLQMNV